MKAFELYESVDGPYQPTLPTTIEEVDKCCYHYGIAGYKINPDLSIDVDGDVTLSAYQFTRMPINFGHIEGVFRVGHTAIKTLEGGPKSVSGLYECNSNENLKSLMYIPRVVKDLWAYECGLESLEGSPEEIDGILALLGNPLKTLKGCPKKIGQFSFVLGTTLSPWETRYILMSDIIKVNVRDHGLLNDIYTDYFSTKQSERKKKIPNVLVNLKQLGR